MSRRAAYPGLLRAALLAVCLALWGGWPAPVHAQETPAPPEAEAPAPPALLVADRVYVSSDRTLVAEGNVEAFQGDTRLRAARIEFDRSQGTLKIDGPIRIDEGGRVTILADAAEMDDGLRNGLLTGARMVLDQQVQLAALQMSRVSGRYTQLYKSAVTSCHVCDDRPPLWQIRAKRVVHDQLERQLYFEEAQVRVLDVPVLYLPALRLPDPTLKRATGFLIPSIRTTTQLATGVKVPYFIRMGDHRDLTLEPYLSSRTRTLNWRYRQAFRRGRLEFEGAITRDDLIPGETRGVLFGEGLFDLGNDFELSFDIQATSDNAYLLDYGWGDLDRLKSEIALTRTKRNRFFRTSLIHFDSLRDGENESTLPTIVGDVRYEQRLFPNAIGGELRLAMVGHGHYRSSDLDVLGRDILRATAEAYWLRSWIGAQGLRADAEIGAAIDSFRINQDSFFPTRANRFTPRAGLTLRYPMARTTARGGIHQIEPVLQLAWSDVQGDPVPNDESRFSEFDRGNLLSLSRFPAYDRREDGPRMAYGLHWSRFGQGGWEASATVGQVIRKTADPSFTQSSGLSGTSSDILVAGQYKAANGLNLVARTLFDDAFSFSKAEFRGRWHNSWLNLDASYLWLGADPVEGRTRALSEIWFDGDYRVNQNWTAGANLRYDLSAASATTAGIGLIYRNECVEVDLSVDRRYTSSTSVEPSTVFGFTIALRGFSVAGDKERYKRTCS